MEAMRKWTLYLLPFSILLLSSHALKAQLDSLIMRNGDTMVGEIKEMKRDVLTIEPDYAENIFEVDWDEVDQLFSAGRFAILLKGGQRVSGFISSPAPGTLNIQNETDSTVVLVNDVIYVDPFDTDFISRLSLAADLGFSQAKANDNRQLQFRGNVGYKTRDWALRGNIDSFNNSRNDAEDINRLNGGGYFRLFIGGDWFTQIGYDFLRNSEQSLNWRGIASLGVGTSLVQTDLIYWDLTGGFNWTTENFFDETGTPSSSDAEAFVATEFDILDLGDFDLLSKTRVTPSISNGGRVRIDFNIDLKYELPLGFDIKVGYTHNFDNRPANTAPRNDYIFGIYLGWEL